MSDLFLILAIIGGVLFIGGLLVEGYDRRDARRRNHPHRRRRP